MNVYTFDNICMHINLLNNFYNIRISYVVTTDKRDRIGWIAFLLRNPLINPLSLNLIHFANSSDHLISYYTLYETEICSFDSLILLFYSSILSSYKLRLIDFIFAWYRAEASFLYFCRAKYVIIFFYSLFHEK